MELVSLNGNVVSDGQDGLHHHTHALLSCKDASGHRMMAGHVKSITVLYTAEIELRPIIGDVIRRQPDPETETGFWSFQQGREG